MIFLGLFFLSSFLINSSCQNCKFWVRRGESLLSSPWASPSAALWLPLSLSHLHNFLITDRAPLQSCLWTGIHSISGWIWYVPFPSVDKTAIQCAIYFLWTMPVVISYPSLNPLPFHSAMCSLIDPIKHLPYELLGKHPSWALSCEVVLWVGEERQKEGGELWT